MQTLVYLLGCRRIAEPPFLTLFLALLRLPVGKPPLVGPTNRASLLSVLLLVPPPQPPGPEARPRLHVAHVRYLFVMSSMPWLFAQLLYIVLGISVQSNSITLARTSMTRLDLYSCSVKAAVVGLQLSVLKVAPPLRCRPLWRTVRACGSCSACACRATVPRWRLCSRRPGARRWASLLRQA